VNQEESEQNEVDGMKKGAVKEQLVICNEEDTDGRARVTTEEERVLHTEQR